MQPPLKALTRLARLRGFVLAFMLTSMACSSAERVVLVPELPADVAFGALLVMRGEGFVEATPLTPISNGRFVSELATVPDPDSTFFFVGYRLETLEGVLPADLGELADAPLRAPEAGRPGLPPPDHRAEGTNAEVSRLEATERDAPPLAADWLPDCPQLEIPEPYVAEVNCTQTNCQPRISQRGCVLTFEISSCLVNPDGAELVASVGADGSLDVEPYGGQVGDCEQVEPELGADLALECKKDGVSSCTISRYPGPFAEPMTVDSIDLLGPGLRWMGSPAENTFEGYIQGLAQLRDGTLAALTQEWGRIVLCDELEPGALMYVNPDSLEVVRTTTVSNCMGSIVADPGGPGLLAVSNGLDDLELLRLGASGRVVQSWPLPISDRDPREAFTPIAMLIWPEENRLFVLLHDLGLDLEEDARRGVLLTLDLATFETIAQTTLSDRQARIMRRLPTGGREWLGVFEDRRDVLDLVDPASGEIDDQSSYRTELQPGRDLADALYDPARDRIILANTAGPFDGVVTFDLNERRPGILVAPGEIISYPSAFTFWPPDSDFYLTSLVGRDVDRTSYLGLSTLRDDRMRYLPGLTEAGIGLARFMQTDARGRIWLAFPLTGRISRVTPK